MPRLYLSIVLVLSSIYGFAQPTFPTAKEMLQTIECRDSACFADYCTDKGYNLRWYDKDVSVCPIYCFGVDKDSVLCAPPGELNILLSHNVFTYAISEWDDSVSFTYATYCKDVYDRVCKEYMAEDFTILQPTVTDTFYGVNNLTVYTNKKKPALELAFQVKCSHKWVEAVDGSGKRYLEPDSSKIEYSIILSHKKTKFKDLKPSIKPPTAAWLLQAIKSKDDSAIYKYAEDAKFESLGWPLPSDSLGADYYCYFNTHAECPEFFNAGSVLSHIFSKNYREVFYSTSCPQSYEGLLKEFKQLGFVEGITDKDTCVIYTNKNMPELELKIKIPVRRYKGYRYDRTTYITYTSYAFTLVKRKRL